MRSIRVYQFGPPHVLTVEQTPEPQAGPGQLIIAVEAAGVLFAETQTRAGHFPNARLAFPFVPGLEVAGRVIGVELGGDQSWLGSRVVANTFGFGGYAERAVVEATNAFRLPPDLSIGQAIGVFPIRTDRHRRAEHRAD
jgi:NADPH2:quinone reductase